MSESTSSAYYQSVATAGPLSPEVAIATPWRRVLAYLTDGFILGVVGFGAGSILSQRFSELGPRGRLVGWPRSGRNAWVAHICPVLADVGRCDSNWGSRSVTHLHLRHANNLATATYPNGLQSTFQYDTLNRLTSMTAGTAAAYGYTLGPTGNRTNVMELSGRSVTWSFDGIYRLTGETITGDSQYNGSVGYGLDPVGNRLSATSSLHGVSPASFSYNADDQILSSVPCALYPAS